MNQFIFHLRKDIKVKGLFLFRAWNEVNWPQASFVLCTGGQHFLCFNIICCSWCLFISQRLCVNMSIWIKHIVCIYCLFIALLVRTIIFHSMFTPPPELLKLLMEMQNGLYHRESWEHLLSLLWLIMLDITHAQFESMKKSLRTPE